MFNPPLYNSFKARDILLFERKADIWRKNTWYKYDYKIMIWKIIATLFYHWIFFSFWKKTLIIYAKRRTGLLLQQELCRHVRLLWKKVLQSQFFILKYHLNHLIIILVYLVHTTFIYKTLNILSNGTKSPYK